MSPEPTQEPIQESLTASNVPLDARMANDSDSEDEDMGMTGYIPLSQIPTDTDPILEDGDECFLHQNDVWLSGVSETNQEPPSPVVEAHQSFLQNDEWLSGLSETNQEPPSPVVEAHQSFVSEVLEVWSCPYNRSDIDLDAAKIKQVKSVMESITLPETSIPQWASAISEDQWKEQLLVRIKEMQNKDP